MKKYLCKNCGHQGEKLIFELNDYVYCLATNFPEDPEYLAESPQWVRDKEFGSAEIGNPVGCPKCHAWGNDKFEII